MARTTATIIFLGFLAISQVFGESIVSELESELKEATDWMEQEAAEVKSAYTGAFSDVKAAHNDAMNKVKSISDLYDRALGVVESSPKECQSNIKNTLMTLKYNGVGSFFTCSKLLEAGEDIIDIGITTADIAFDVVDIGRDVTVGFSGCLSSFWPWKIVECWYDRITTTIDDIKRSLSDIKNYVSNIKELTYNATTLIEVCWHGTSSVHSGNVLAIMTPLHKCAKQPIPYDLYKL